MSVRAPWFPALQRRVRRWFYKCETCDGLLRETDQERAMLRAMMGGREIAPDAARAVLAVSLAEYVDKWLPPLHRGTTLHKGHEMTLDQVAEMAHDVVILGATHSQEVPR